MEQQAVHGSESKAHLLRIIGWSAAGLILLLPLVAMQFTEEVNWSVADFAFMAVLILAVGIPLEIAVRKATLPTYRLAVAVALFTAFCLVWANGAVGIIGAENNPINLLYWGVLGVGLVGAAGARFRAQGMAAAIAVMAIAQAAIALGAIVAGAGGPASGPLEITLVNGMFVALWLLSAALFQRAAKAA